MFIGRQKKIHIHIYTIKTNFLKTTYISFATPTILAKGGNLIKKKEFVRVRSQQLNIHLYYTYFLAIRIKSCKLKKQARTTLKFKQFALYLGELITLITRLSKSVDHNLCNTEGQLLVLC